MEIITNENTGIVLYANLLSDIKTRIRQAQFYKKYAAIMKQPVSLFELTRALPENRSGLPRIEELEEELGGVHQEERRDE
ncbi:MAG: hypothetical protein ACNYWM_10925 [Methanosarcinales archaeon]